jgi:hypothetical protein
LTDVPHASSLCKKSVLGHSFESKDDSFVCSVVTNKSAGMIYGRWWKKKSGGGKRRTTRLQKDHHILYDALMEFRRYQTLIQGIQDGDNNVPSAPQKATVDKFEKVREECILQQMQRLLPHEERLCYDSLMCLIFHQGTSFSLVESQDMR